MSKRYIELYSRNRNRTEFPLPSSYEVPFAPTRQILSASFSTDPICTGSIYYTWNGGNSSITPNSYIISGATLSPGYNSNPGCIYLSYPGLSDFYNYYIGYQLVNLTTNNIQTIINYDPTSAKFILDKPFINGIAAGNTFAISDPSNGTGNPATIYIPSKDIYNNKILQYSEAYNGYYIVDETLSVSGGSIIASKIVEYNFITQTATLEKPFPMGWTVTDRYTLRRTTPQEKFLLTSAYTINTSTFINQYQNVIPGLIITLPTSQGNTGKNYYAGKYVYYASNTSDPDINGGGIYGLYFIKASQYNGMNVQLLIEYDTNSAYNNNIPTTGSTINIVGYIKNNFCPLNYNGSIVSQNESVCYEISLVGLTLPNLPLVTGSRIVFYPFVYVEFINSTSPSGSSNDVIYSNNPDSGRALFICPVTDTSQPINSNFMKLYSNMIQTVKFKPNDSLRFSVYLPDGRQFETVQDDYLSPYPPNGSLQIEAIFGIRRI